MRLQIRNHGRRCPELDTAGVDDPMNNMGDVVDAPSRHRMLA